MIERAPLVHVLHGTLLSPECQRSNLLSPSSLVKLTTYVAATSCVCYSIWLRNLLKKLSLLKEEPTKFCFDNKSAIALANNHVFHDRIKHIETHYHYIRECITKKEVQVEYVKS